VMVTFLSSVQGWGDDGHQIVAQVASSYLTSTTQQQVAKILGSYTLANVSTWPDNYDHTSEGAWSEHLHYVNLETTEVTFNYSVCVPPVTVPYGCVIAAITNFTDILKHDYANNEYQKCSDPNGEPCPLSFLTHFLGDSHQPLHVAYAIDEGGNNFDVEYDGECTNLHSVWDSRLIYTYEDDNDIEWYGISQEILNWLQQDPTAVSVFTNKTEPADWGDETFAICRFAPYNLSPGTVPGASGWVHSIYGYITPSNVEFNPKNSALSCDGPTLTTQYYERCIPVVFDQLAKSGTRLGYLLNSIFDPSFNGTMTQN